MCFVSIGYEDAESLNWVEVVAVEDKVFLNFFQLAFQFQLVFQHADENIFLPAFHRRDVTSTHFVIQVIGFLVINSIVSFFSLTS